MSAEMDRVRKVAQMVSDDAEADAKARVELTALGLGVARGEMLAQIDALARLVIALADHVDQLEGRLP